MLRKHLFLKMMFCDASLDQARDGVWDTSMNSTWSYVVTPNAAHLARLSDGDTELQEIYKNATLCFLDSRVIARVARLVGLAPPTVVTGADLVAELLRTKIDAHTPVCIVGGTADMVDRLRVRFNIDNIQHRNPSVGFWSKPGEMEELVSFVVKAQAAITFLAVGSPQQELLADRIAKHGGARGVGICVGASLEFVTDMRSRAPVILQRLSMEWAYRLWTEPRRMWRRYFIESPRALYLVFCEGLKN